MVFEWGFGRTPNLIFRIGAAPSCIDILTSIDGAEFDEACLDDAE